MEISQSGTTWDDGLSLSLSGNRWNIVHGGDSNLYFGFDYSPKLCIEPDGDLVVFGDIIAVGSCCDYIFKDNYKLPTLKELDHYINKNRCLPNMTINKGGKISFQAMQKELIEKTEEQTLYILQLHKRLEVLEKYFKTINGS